MGQVHSDPGPHDPRSPLQIIHLSPARQEAQTLRSDTGGTLPSGADGPPGSADEWPEVNAGTTWEDYGPRPQVPKGYTLNEGADYVPFNIRLPSGEMKPAKYIKLEYGEDPLVYGMINGDPHQYVESFHVTFLDYLYAIHMQTYSDCSFPFSISIHSSGMTLISVLLHRDLSYHCTIQSDSSILSPSLVTL